MSWGVVYSVGLSGIVLPFALLLGDLRRFATALLVFGGDCAAGWWSLAGLTRISVSDSIGFAKIFFFRPLVL